MQDVAEQRRWEAESAANTLIEAEKIRANKPLLRRATAEIRKRQQAVNKALAGPGRKSGGGRKK